MAGERRGLFPEDVQQMAAEENSGKAEMQSRAKHLEQS